MYHRARFVGLFAAEFAIASFLFVTPNLLVAQDASSPQATGKIAFSAPKAVSWIDYFAEPTATGDVNGDGNTDVFTSNGIYLGNGKGGFSKLQNVPYINWNSLVLPPLDVNGDKKLDAVLFAGQYDTNSCAVTIPSQIDIDLGSGKGTFSQHASYLLPEYSLVEAAVTGDFNHDGRPDLAVFARFSDYCGGTSELIIFINKGQGNFVQAQTMDIPSGTYDIVAADFNGDGIPDLALASTVITKTTSSGAIRLLDCNGDGTFRTGPVYQFPAGPLGQTPSGVGGMAAADLNGDKKADLVITLFPQNYPNGHKIFKVVTLLSKASGGFSWYSSVTLAAQPWQFINPKLVDLNGDGKLDLLLPFYVGTLYGGSSVEVLTGEGGGKFSAPQAFPALPHLFYAVPFPLKTGGRPDILIESGQNNKEPYALMLNESN